MLYSCFHPCLNPKDFQTVALILFVSGGTTRTPDYSFNRSLSASTLPLISKGSLSRLNSKHSDDLNKKRKKEKFLSLFRHLLDLENVNSLRSSEFFSSFTRFHLFSLFHLLLSLSCSEESGLTNSTENYIYWFNMNQGEINRDESA